MAPGSAEPTYLVRVAALLLDDAARAGLDREAILRSVRVDSGALRDPDARLPLATVVAIARAVIAAADDRSFGVRAGAARRAKDGGLIGYAMLHSATLRDALVRLVRYGRIVGDHNHFEMEESGSFATIVLDPHPAIAAIHELIELDVAWVIAILREIAAPDLDLVEVRFPHPEPGHVAQLRAHCRCPLQFEATRVAIVLQRNDLDRSVTAADSTLAGYLDRLADDAMKALGSVETTTGRLRQLLWPRLSDGAPTLATAAAALALSPRTLQRRLAEEGTTFAEALSALRHDLAVTLLRDKKLAVYEVGFLVGYVDQSAFHKAFRRWRGMSPRRFREQAREAR
jgi:AraC-like DNA-binding protein